jgi:large subunit ribosomal protein L15
MKLNNLEKIRERSKKRVGRGTGSGKGKTGGRGMKGQKARGKIPAAFIGGSLPLYKKLPFVRGWGNKKANEKPVVLTLDHLNNFKANSSVTISTLVEARIIGGRNVEKKGVKILDQGEVKVNGLTIEVPVSESAKAKIEKLGGKVV